MNSLRMEKSPYLGRMEVAVDCISNKLLPTADHLFVVRLQASSQMYNRIKEGNIWKEAKSFITQLR